MTGLGIFTGATPRDAGLGPEADETGLTRYFFFTAVLAGSVALAAGDVGGQACCCAWESIGLVCRPDRLN